MPGPGDEPAIWLLGSSDFSARLAGELGLPFSFAHHFMPHNTLAALDVYRRSFRPSAALDEPYAMVGVQAVCAEHRRAGAVARTARRRCRSCGLRTGRARTFPSPEEAAATTTRRRSGVRRQLAAGHIVGSPEPFATGCSAAGAHGADELMVTTMVHSHADRLRSYELVAGVLAAAPASQAA